MSNILQVAVPTGQPALAWPARSDPTVNSLLFINQDINNTVWLGQTSTVTAGGVNSIPILPNGTFSGDSASAWYVVGNIAGTQPLVMVPNGQAYFLGLTAGLGKLVIPQIQSPNFVTGVSGWIIRKDGSAEFNSIVIRGSTVLGSVTLLYSGGSPALNTLIYSNSVTEFKDSGGNWVLSGETTYGPDPFTGVGFIAQNLSAGITTFYHTTGTTMGGSTPPWQADAIFSWANSEGMLLQEAAGFGITLESLNGGSTTLIGKPTGETISGYTGQLSIDRTDTTLRTNANNGTVQITPAWPIPANDGVVGSTYILNMPFSGTLQNQSLAFKPTLNGAGLTTSNGDVIPGNFFGGAATGITGHIRLTMVVKTIGSGGSVDYYIDGGFGQNAVRSSGTNNNNAFLSSQSTNMPFDTTSINTIGINSTWGASTTGQTIGVLVSQITRKGP